MAHKHSLPSKLEEFVTVFAGALGFSILFLFALSSFVNNLYHRDSGSEHGQMAATTPGEMPKSTPETHGTQAAKPTDAPKVASVSIGEMLASGNADKGAKVAKKCLACHSFDKGGKNKVGPNLYGIVGKNVGVTKGFKYSKAMKNYAGKNKNWEYANLVTFLKKPKKAVPKTKMAFAGLKKDKDLSNLIAYLRTNAETPVPLPAK